MKKALLLVLAAYFSFGSFHCLAQEGNGAPVPLSAQEKQVLLAADVQTPSLLEQTAGGCRTVWDNDNQQDKTVCYSPMGMGLAGGMMGGLLGSFYGIAGAVAGAATGGLALAVLTAIAYSE
jgi:hypothetical protein